MGCVIIVGGLLTLCGIFSYVLTWNTSLTAIKSNLWSLDKNNEHSQVTLSNKMGEFISIQNATEL